MVWRCRFCRAETGAPLVPACPACEQEAEDGSSVSVYEAPTEPAPPLELEHEPEPA